MNKRVFGAKKSLPKEAIREGSKTKADRIKTALALYKTIEKAFSPPCVKKIALNIEHQYSSLTEPMKFNGAAGTILYL